MRQMAAIELQDFLATSASAIKIDVRDEAELKHGCFEDALHIPMENVLERLNELEPHKNDTLVLLCRTGGRSAQVGQFLEQMGFTDVINLMGGMNSWAADVDTSMVVY